MTARTALVATALAAIAAGCSSATAVWTVKPDLTSVSSPSGVFVMAPEVDLGASTGNIGRNVPDVEQQVEARILSIAREIDPGARLADTTGQTPFLPMARYIDAVAPARLARGEMDAAGYAVRHGGTRLLVPTILEWREMRTDDPIGALTVPHNRVTIALRLVRLDSVGVAGSVTFENHARVTLNQSADRLLNDEFRRTLLRLLQQTRG